MNEGYILCGGCLYYDKCDNCIKGACGVTVNLFKDGILLGCVTTDKCGNYVFKVNELGTYLLVFSRCDKCKSVCITLCADPNNVYLKNVIFE